MAARTDERAGTADQPVRPSAVKMEIDETEGPSGGGEIRTTRMMLEASERRRSRGRGG